MKLRTILKMRVNKALFNIFIISIAFSFGILITSLFLNKPLIENNFFNFRLIELIRLLIMLFLGYFVAYWVSLKINSMQKKKDLCLRLINEGNTILSEQKDKTVSFMEQNKKSEGKLILSGFRRLNNKIYTIETICEKIDKNLSTDALSEEFIKLKSQFGDNYLTGFTVDNQQRIIKDFDKYEKIFDDLRIKILL